MLFDLRSRGRRRTVQVIYISLAVLIGAGLILFGVGTGTGGGGLFGAFTGNGGSSNSAKSAINAATKKAIAQAKANPQSAAAWANLVNARQSAANSAGGLDQSTGAYTQAGKQQLALLIAAYHHYAGLVHTPNVNASTLAARAYTQLGQYSNAATTYQQLLAAEPASIHALECVAFTSYAAGNTRVGDLAKAKLTTKPAFKSKQAQKTLSQEVAAVKKTPSLVAQAC
jgi:tetratricopeptide (TPR) repeat protein